MNAIKRLWERLRQPDIRRTTVGAILIVGFSCGSGGVIILNIVLASTNTMTFCTGCHEMGTALYELQQTKHYSNRVGVQAGCPDCHVPTDGLPKYMAKLAAAKDVWGNLLGVINTPEKYEALRPEMAKAVWTRLKETDSRECRICHSFAAMDFSEQDKIAARKHQRVMESNADEHKTCIDCHKGVAHKLPQDTE